MTCGWTSRVLRAALLLPLAAGPLAAQVRHEAGVTLVAFAGHPGFAGGGATLAFRPTERLRVAGTALAGARDAAVVRGELAAHFLLYPARTRGPALYAGGGLAAESGPAGQAWLLAVVGLEGAPGARRGWVVEVGVGGGVRVAVGWRWRG